MAEAAAPGRLHGGQVRAYAADGAPPPASAPESERLRWAAREFETLFLQHLLRSMRQTVPESPLFGRSPGVRLFEGLLDDERARVMAQGDGIGLGRMLYDDLSRFLAAEPPQGASLARRG